MFDWGLAVEVPRLREWRLRRALAQRDLARVSRVGVATIARLERGHQRAQPGTARRLAEALDVDVAYLQTPIRSIQDEKLPWDDLRSIDLRPIRKEDV